MALLRWRLWLVVLTGVVVSMIIAVVLVNPRLTRYVESQAFREELDKQTSKGLHFQGRYKEIQRTGFLTARAEGFTGNDGVKAIKTMSTGEVDAKFTFYIQGTVLVDKRSLSGSVQFGATRKYLEWLPRAEEIFAREKDGYLWTTVNLAGSLQKPQEDLSPRVAELLKKSPGAAIGIFLRRIGEWFEETLGGK